jgi:hypothetical protein
MENNMAEKNANLKSRQKFLVFSHSLVFLLKKLQTNPINVFRHDNFETHDKNKKRFI